MDTVLGLLSILCVIAAVVLFILFIVRWIRKKRKLWFGLSSLFCLIGAVILAVVGSQLWLHNMTPEERAAYEQRLEQEAEERRLAEEAAASQQAKAESEAAESQRLKEESEAAASSARVASEKAASEAAESAAHLEEEKRLSVTFDEIYYAYKQNELRADDIYKNNRYRITAKINGMTTGGILNLTGGATLTMETRVDNIIVFFYAEFERDQEEALKTVNVGDTITFDGTCISAGNWEDCELILE